MSATTSLDSARADVRRTLSSWHSLLINRDTWWRLQNANKHEYLSTRCCSAIYEARTAQAVVFHFLNFSLTVSFSLPSGVIKWSFLGLFYSLCGQQQWSVELSTDGKFTSSRYLLRVHVTRFLLLSNVTIFTFQTQAINHGVQNIPWTDYIRFITTSASRHELWLPARVAQNNKLLIMKFLQSRLIIRSKNEKKSEMYTDCNWKLKQSLKQQLKTIHITHNRTTYPSPRLMATERISNRKCSDTSITYHKY